MLKGKAIRVEGWGRDSDRYWRMMCCDLLVGRGSGSFPLVVMFVRCSIRLAGDQDSLVESISDFNRWSEMEVCDRSRFELCHLTRIHVVRLSRILVGGWLPEY